ncbi:CheR family methyltransferase [Myxococcus sp. MxC21-1]|uniref:CheR family methyltransferase n=1 Tax=Myxococcus sp. MxC21-1 TaxID=3041439 RepID=UPI002B2C9A1D|nr:CheR family methyltransferase [Myxococcus sp. MxC21-1]
MVPPRVRAAPLPALLGDGRARGHHPSPVRRITTFAQANLLAPLPERFGRFDFILCRNVLTYFTPAARDAAISLLSRTLNPGGWLFLGAVEVDRVPAGMVREGPPELQAFRLLTQEELNARAAAASRAAALARPVAPPSRRPVAPLMPVVAREVPAAPPPPPTRLHLNALERIEEGDEVGASSVLEALVRRRRTTCRGCWSWPCCGSAPGRGKARCR